MKFTKFTFEDYNYALSNYYKRTIYINPNAITFFEEVENGQVRVALREFSFVPENITFKELVALVIEGKETTAKLLYGNDNENKP